MTLKNTTKKLKNHRKNSLIILLIMTILWITIPFTFEYGVIRDGNILYFIVHLIVSILFLISTLLETRKIKND